jgi:hypothetical protein
MGLRADLVEFGGVSGDACVSARSSSYRPKVTVHAGYAVQIRRPKSTPHIHGSELGHSADCRQDNRRQKLNCIGCLGRCSFYEANLRFIPEDMTSEGVRTLSTEFQIFISSTVEDLKSVRSKLLCALEQPGRIVRCSEDRRFPVEPGMTSHDRASQLYGVVMRSSC